MSEVCKQVGELKRVLKDIERTLEEIAAAMRYPREVIADCLYSLLALRVSQAQGRYNELTFTNTDLQEACYALTRFVPNMYDIKRLLGEACAVEVKSFRQFDVRCDVAKLEEVLKARGYLS